MAQILSWDERPTSASRRSAFEVRMDVLKAVAGGAARPTRIMYSSNTSWVVLQKNLAAFVASGLVRESGESARQEYTITDTGMDVVRDYAALVEKATEKKTEVRF